MLNLPDLRSHGAHRDGPVAECCGCGVPLEEEASLDNESSSEEAHYHVDG
jgi:hypothetical protein